MESLSKYYPKILAGLVIVVVMLCVVKAGRDTEENVLEVNYTGDLESENQEQAVEEVEPLEITGIIRVLVMDTGYQNIEHEQIEISAESGLEIYYEDRIEYIEPGESLVITWSEEGLDVDSIIIYPVEEEEKVMISSIERSYGYPQYYGSLEIYAGENGFVVVNELELEEYLKGVLPSEMPSSYEFEALKAQAVCARSYAYQHLTQYNYPEYEAHINDSTAYQVYNNVEESDVSNMAIEETEGELLVLGDQVVTTYFFSTSSGYTTDIEAWGEEMTEEYAYLQSISVSDGEKDYEADLPWYRWEIAISKEEMEILILANLEAYIEANTVDDMEESTDASEDNAEVYTDIGELISVEVVEYGAGNIVAGLEIEGTLSTIVIENEYDIRSILGGNSECNYSVALQDGSSREWSSILPSAFFELTYIDEIYYISGGGYGHGIGMSQNGANEMAKLGYDYIEILQFFYSDVEILE